MKNRFKIKKNKPSDPFVIQEGGGKKIEGYSYRTSWTEDSYAQDAGTGEIVGNSFDFNRIKFVVFFVLFFISFIFFRIAWLQVVKGSYYYGMAEGNRIRIERVEAKRGVIYDRNMKPLVRNVANFLLYFVPSDLPREIDEKEELIKKISGMIEGLSEEDINEKLSKVQLGTLEALQPLFIIDDIPYEVAMKLYLESQNMPGVVLQNKSRREYNLYTESLSHVLGYTGKINEKELAESGDEYLMIDYIGKTGVEYFWENELKGNSGKRHIEVNALGKKKKVIGTQTAEDGHNLVLSIDVLAQKKLEEIFAAYLEKFNKEKASGVVMDPSNGEVVALVSYPGYDNNLFAQGISQDDYNELLNRSDNPLFNRAVSGEFPSGSTIKPVISVAALEEGIINENTSFNSVGGIRIGQWFFPDWKAGGHGITNVRKAIAQSVNTFYYFIGGGFDNFTGLGVDKIVKYGRLFGMDEQTGIDLVGEATGFLPTKEWKETTKGERWYIGDTYHMAIGQGDVLVTPLQVALFTSVFANGGKLYRPHIVKQLLNSDDHLFSDVETVPVREDFLTDRNIEIVKEGMRQTVTSGSARSMMSLPVEAAGKTGTAQWSSKHDYHAWFTGFAPYDNPELVITILVEEGGGGDVIAVPIAREFLAWYFGEYKGE